MPLARAANTGTTAERLAAIDTIHSLGIEGALARKDPAGYTLMSEPDGPYLFAGEHLAHVGAWQQGAFVSAWRAVNAIAARRQALAA